MSDSPSANESPWGKAIPGTLAITELPPVKAHLNINGVISINSASFPNGWWRFWQWALLGWKWRRL